MFKAHKQIIQTFTSRSKSQLFLIAEDEDIMSKIAKESSYGTFIKCLMTPAALSTAIMIDTATNGIGCDEMMVIRVLCTCAATLYFPIELALKTMKGNSFDLCRFIAKNTSKDPNLKIVFQYLLGEITKSKRYERPEDYEASVTKEAEDIFLWLHRTNEPDIDLILGLLVKSSREHCMAIKEAFKKTFNVELVDKLPLRFSPAVVYALNLLMLPEHDSVARVLLDYKNTLGKKADPEFIFAIISRCDKDTLKQIDAGFKLLSGGDSFVKFCSMFRGKLKDAVRGYLENDTPDKKIEFELVRVMKDNGFAMNDISWVKDEKIALTVRDLLEQQVQNLSGHLNVKFSPIPLTNKQEYADANFEEDEEVVAAAKTKAEEEDDESPAVLAKKKRSEMNEKRAISKQNSIHAKSMKAVPAAPLESNPSLESASKIMERVINYLMLLFQWYDSENVGTLDAKVFWDIVTTDKLMLREFGFSSEEISCMEELCDWVDNDTDNDTSTIAYEDVVVELATNIIDCAETNDVDVSKVVKERTVKLSTSAPSQSNATAVAAAQPKTIGASLDATEVEAETAVAGGSSIQNGRVVPDLEKYMRDTFASYDVDQSGFLDISELMQMVTAMNLGTTEDDIEELRTKWDENGDQKITWKEAEPNLVAMIKEMASDMRDHWVSLVS